MIQKLPFFFLLTAILCSNNLFAQWSSDSTMNTAVCIATGNQSNPQICSDGSNGAIIAWEDNRCGILSIYAQKLNADGVPQWKKDGVKLCGVVATQMAPVLCPDGK